MITDVIGCSYLFRRGSFRLELGTSDVLSKAINLQSCCPLLVDLINLSKA